jgi:hypothetical protein
VTQGLQIPSVTLQQIAGLSSGATRQLLTPEPSFPRRGLSVEQILRLPDHGEAQLHFREILRFGNSPPARARME